MNFDSGKEPNDFACGFFRDNGAAVEKHDNGFEAILPESLSRVLKIPEYLDINNESPAESGPQPENTYSVQYGSPLLDKIVTIATKQVPLLSCRLKFDYLKSQGFDRLIKTQFTINKSVGRVENTASIMTEYLNLTCRYLAQSDEQKEGLINLVFNLETGANTADMDSKIAYAAKDFNISKRTTNWNDKKIKDIMQWVQKGAEDTIAKITGPFHESMTRRFRRDATNLEEYYDSLKKEMETSLQKPGLSARLIKDRKDKIALIPDELTKKKDDLFKKYSIKVKITLCGLMLITTPAVKILYRTSIGRKNKQFSLIYNPISKRIDPLVCEACKKSTFNVYFCDNLHLLCPDCIGKCPIC